MSTLQLDFLESIYKIQKETSLFGKWIHYNHISPLLNKLSVKAEVNQIGVSENKTPIHSVKIGSGDKKILIWSQMHGNESTGTRALFDLLNTLTNASGEQVSEILNECTILAIPMLNPDGSYNYTRVNANNVDLNRDVIARAAVESNLLRTVLEDFNPQFCFNLHDQRTIFGVEGTENPASISFLAPSEEETRMLTGGRKETMNVIIAMNSLLQKVIPNHIGRYTDEFYPTATGDNFQKLGYNTILIEAGHYPNDYEREEVRKFNFFALLKGIHHIAINTEFTNYKEYFNIPNNQENFFDVIEKDTKESSLGAAYQYIDSVKDGQFISKKTLERKGDLSKYLAHEYVFLKK